MNVVFDKMVREKIPEMERKELHKVISYYQQQKICLWFSATNNDRYPNSTKRFIFRLDYVCTITTYEEYRKPTIKRDLYHLVEPMQSGDRDRLQGRNYYGLKPVSDGEWYDLDPYPTFQVIPVPVGHQNKTKKKNYDFYVFIKVLQQDSFCVPNFLEYPIWKVCGNIYWFNDRIPLRKHS
jgi:hypothetical protein